VFLAPTPVHGAPFTHSTALKVRFERFRSTRWVTMEIRPSRLARTARGPVPVQLDAVAVGVAQVERFVTPWSLALPGDGEPYQALQGVGQAARVGSAERNDTIPWCRWGAAIHPWLSQNSGRGDGGYPRRIQRLPGAQALHQFKSQHAADRRPARAPRRRLLMHVTDDHAGSMGRWVP